MENTRETVYKLTKNTAILTDQTWDGKKLLSSVHNSEMFIDYFEDIFENLEPGNKETISEDPNRYKIEADFQEHNKIFISLFADHIKIVWYAIEDEDGTLYGRSWQKNIYYEPLDEAEFIKRFEAADEENKAAIRKLLQVEEIYNL